MGAIESIAARVRSGAASAKEIAEDALKKTRERDPALGAFLTIDEASLFEDAKRVDEKRARGEPLGALAGVPIAIKDAISTRGIRTTCASKVLEGYVPPYDATVIEKLRAADAIVFGKANMDELAMGSSNENSAFFPAKNPWDPKRIPGGSSGGSAVAVAARMTPAALGSDTGGSVRQPAALTGTVGVKPTYGRVSRYGLVAFASSLDQIGPFANDVKSAALVLSTIAGHDSRDATSLDAPVPDYVAGCSRDVRGLRIGVPEEYFGEGLADDVRASVDAAISELTRAGCVTKRVKLPHTKHAVATYYLVATAEASSNLSRFDGVRYGLRAEGPDLRGMYGATRNQGFGAEVKRRILLGTFALSAGYYDAYYAKAQRVRALIREDFARAFEEVDAIVSPTSPTTAFTLGEKTMDPLAMYLSDVYTLPASLAGLPAISVPCAPAANGLPVGLQIVTRHLDEETMLAVAAAWEARNASRDLAPHGFS